MFYFNIIGKNCLLVNTYDSGSAVLGFYMLCFI